MRGPHSVENACTRASQWAFGVPSCQSAPGAPLNCSLLPALAVAVQTKEENLALFHQKAEALFQINDRFFAVVAGGGSVHQVADPASQLHQTVVRLGHEFGERLLDKIQRDLNVALSDVPSDRVPCACCDNSPLALLVLLLLMADKFAAFDTVGRGGAEDTGTVPPPRSASEEKEEVASTEKREARGGAQGGTCVST